MASNLTKLISLIIHAEGESRWTGRTSRRPVEEHGLGRITVGLEEYFDFGFSLSDELQSWSLNSVIFRCVVNRLTPEHEV